MVEAFLLRQREALPPLVEVAQPRVDLVVVYSAWNTKEGNAVDFQVALVLEFSRKVSGPAAKDPDNKNKPLGYSRASSAQKSNLKALFRRGQRSTDIYFSTTVDRCVVAACQRTWTSCFGAACPLQRAVTTEESDSSQICVSSTSRAPTHTPPTHTPRWPVSLHGDYWSHSGAYYTALSV